MENLQDDYYVEDDEEVVEAELTLSEPVVLCAFCQRPESEHSPAALAQHRELAKTSVPVITAEEAESDEEKE